jgi:hypothetical protein
MWKSSLRGESGAFKVDRVASLSLLSLKRPTTKAICNSRAIQLSETPRDFVTFRI